MTEKVSLAILMGLGLLAAVCGLMKAALIKAESASTNPVVTGASIAIWT
jgi:hypothetical protein